MTQLGWASTALFAAGAALIALGIQLGKTKEN